MEARSLWRTANEFSFSAANILYGKGAYITPQVVVRVTSPFSGIASALAAGDLLDAPGIIDGIEVNWILRVPKAYPIGSKNLTLDYTRGECIVGGLPTTLQNRYGCKC
jgi:hypothetical protein